MSIAAELLAEARARAGLSQAELARRAGMPRSVVNAYERGKRQPSPDTLVRILSAAGFRLQLSPRIDEDRAGRLLAQVLDLAEALPYRPRARLAYPPLRRRAG